MTTETNRYETMSDNEIWERIVGEQSRRDFVDNVLNSEEDTNLAAELEACVQHATMLDYSMTDAECATVRTALDRHIRRAT